MPRSGWRYVVAALIGLGCVLLSPPQSHGGQKQSNAYQTPRNGEGVAPLPQSAPDAKDENKPCDPGEDDRKSDLCAQWKAADAAADSARWTRMAFWAAIAGLVVGAFTLASAVVAAKGAWDAARQTEQSVKESRDGNLVARQALAAERRAYVAATDFTIEMQRGRENDRNRGYNVNFHWNNTGSSQTKRAVTYASWQIREGDLPEGFIYPNIPWDGKALPVFIAANSHIVAEPMFVERDLFRRVTREGQTLYVWGWCEYNDVIPETPRHRTEFCVQISIDAVITDPTDDAPGQTAMRMRTYGLHNAADEDCMKQPQT